MKDDTTEMMLIAGAALLGTWVVYNYFTKPSQLTPAQAKQTFETAGATVQNSTIQNDTGTYFVKAGDTLYRFNANEYNNLNFAQRTFINLDRFVPGTWLTRMVLNP